MKVWIFLLTIVVADAKNPFDNYCNVDSCDNRPHTMCIYTNKNKCLSSNKQTGLTKNETIEILDLHNELRQKVARGEEKRGAPGPQPPAKKIGKLYWDEELAEIAQMWANQCQYGHDECRDTNQGSVGQNVAMTGTTDKSSIPSVEKLIRKWYDEVKDFNGKLINKPFKTTLGNNGAKIGHYTQLIWGKTTKIGCGAVKYEKNGFNNLYLVCNYWPSGNVIGEMIYEPNKRKQINKVRPNNGKNDKKWPTSNYIEFGKPGMSKKWPPYGYYYPWYATYSQRLSKGRI